MGSSKNVPEICERECPAVRLAGFEQAGLTFSSDCSGPGMVAQDAEIDRVSVDIMSDKTFVGQKATIEAGRITCRNMGLNESLDARINEGRA